MGEILVQRDERGRILGFAARDLGTAKLAGEVGRMFEAAVSVLTEYLHVHAECSLTEEMALVVDREGPHLDRELDAVFETLVTGFRLLERDYGGKVAVHEGSIGVGVR
ncbi:MAG: hypothetical protein AB1778_09535 [Candidatus Bipolaricaulota bacterium]